MKLSQSKPLTLFFFYFCLDLTSYFYTGTISQKFNGYHKSIFTAINNIRVSHGVPQLKWDRQLNHIAQNYSVKLASLGNQQHSGNGYGENLYTTRNITKPTSDQIVQTWYQESSLYNFDHPFFNPKCLNLTAMIWKSSRNIGIGSAKRNGFWAIVVNFFQPTNIRGQFPTNVFPAQ